MTPAEPIPLLLVEDNPPDTLLLRGMLRAHGRFEVTEAASLGAAREALARRRFAVVLLDLSLPDSLGLATIDKLHAAAPEAPIVVLTGTTDEDVALAAVNHGAQDYLVKGRVDGALVARTIRYAIERKQSEEALRQQREWLRVTLTSIGDAVIATDMEGRVTFLNPVAAALTGWREPDALGQPVQRVFRIINERTRQPAEDIVSRVLREGLVIELANHTSLVTRDGREIPIEDSAAPIKDAGGVAGVVLVFHDVTEKRRAREALARERANLQTMFDVANVGLLLIGEGGEVRRINNTVSRWVGKDRSECLGAQPGDVLGCVHAMAGPGGCGRSPRCASCAIRAAFLSVLRTGRPIHNVEMAATLAINGVADRLWFEVSVDPLVLDGQRHAIMALNNITERKHAEDALRAANAALAEADRRKDEFLAMLAHELRNPLAPIRNAAQLLKMLGPDIPALQRNQEMIARQVSHMTRMLDDLLEVSRVTQGKIRLQTERLDFRVIVAQAVEVNLNALGGRLGLHFQNAPDPLWMEGDPTRLEQVVSNLLGNAVKYTDQGKIWVSLERESIGEGFRAVLRVRDTGVGIAPEMLPRVFDIFAQADQSLERPRGGLGIGLTMVQRLVRMHGGRVEARSDGPGRGSEFIVCLPLSEAPDQSGASPSPPGAGGPARPNRGGRLKALVVDDNEDAARSMAEIMELWGYQAQTVHDGALAVSRALEFSPDVVLLDIGLPGMSGYEVARLLREEELLASVKIIALTGYGQEEARQRSKECGFDGHLVKPVDLSALYALLGRIDSRA